MHFLVVLTFALAFCRASPTEVQKTHNPNCGFEVGQSVRTTSGLVEGQAAPKFDQVSEYLGIPYAKPPTGELRFAPPVAYTSSKKINATKYSPIPRQGLASHSSYLLLAERAQAGHQFSEDCLTLNIWTKPQVGEKAKAVLLYIHGGGFQTGTPNDPQLNGQYFAEKQDVVVVTINYRLNVFGFTGLPGMDQNVGFLDQRLAVKWVYHNIARFGGDPKRITLFGQSAGAASVDIYSFAWTKTPLINAFIEESGTATSFFNPAPPNNTQAWFNATMKLGCGGSTAGIAATVACMRTRDFKAILNATKSTGLSEELGLFGPTVDGKTVFDDYERRALAGQYIRKPYLIGNNDYEAGLFKLTAKSAGLDLPNRSWAIFNLAFFSCPANAAASSRANRVPVYQYRYYGDFPNTRLSSNPSSGAWHGAELPVVWKTTVDSSEKADIPPERLISRDLNHAWAVFAKDPHSALSAAPYGWPRYGSLDEKALIRLVYNNQTRASYISPGTYDEPCDTIRGILAKLSGPFVSLLSAPDSVLAPLDKFENLTAMGGGSEVGY